MHTTRSLIQIYNGQSTTNILVEAGCSSINPSHTHSLPMIPDQDDLSSIASEFVIVDHLECGVQQIDGGAPLAVLFYNEITNNNRIYNL